METLHKITGLSVLALLSMSPPAFAAVSAGEAAALKTTLTPLGAEKAGNKDGSIPAWDGGYTTVEPGFKQGNRRKDPFASDKPLFSISGTNVTQYKDKLPETMVAYLAKYPEGRIDVYQTRRTMAAPQWVYDNTLKNASTAETTNGGYTVKGAYGGIPFPIPKTANEVMWNHILAWRGTAWHQDTDVFYVKDGRPVLTSTVHADYEMPYYRPGKEDAMGPYNWYIRQTTSAPPVRAGEAILGKEALDPIDEGSKAWVYLTGQRRVRALPNSCCDTPTPASAGLINFDEVQGWTGRQDRYDWTLIGKKEIYVPYNTLKIMQPNDSSEVLGKSFLNPDLLRWELHRVWIVEANLRAGSRHVKPKRRYYLDEDSWNVVENDSWDSKGELWSNGFQLTYPTPDLPGIARYTFGVIDLLAGSYLANNVVNNSKVGLYYLDARGDSFFSPDSLAGDGIR